MSIDNSELKTLAGEGEKMKVTVDNLKASLDKEKTKQEISLFSGKEKIEKYIGFCLEKIRPVATDLYAKVDTLVDRFNELKKTVPPGETKELKEVGKKFLAPIEVAQWAFSDIATYGSEAQKKEVAPDIAKLTNYSKAFQVA